METKLQISSIGKGTIVIKQEGGHDFFYSTSNSIIISLPQLSRLLYYLLKLEIIRPGLLDGVLEEFHTWKG